MKTLICLLGMYIDYSPSIEKVYEEPIVVMPNLIVVPAAINIPGLFPAGQQQINPIFLNPILFPPLIPPLPND